MCANRRSDRSRVTSESPPNSAPKSVVSRFPGELSGMLISCGAATAPTFGTEIALCADAPRLIGAICGIPMREKKS